MSKKHGKQRKGHMDPKSRESPPLGENSTEPDWNHECEVCGQTPVVPLTGLCGPCTFGEADTVGGNW
jgi:hypothetical protein